MDLPNKYFEDFPIEYKELNADDFSEAFKVEKTTIELEEMESLMQSYKPSRGFMMQMKTTSYL